MRRLGRAGGVLVLVLGIGCGPSLHSQESQPAEAETPNTSPASPAAQESVPPPTEPAPADAGTLLVAVSGNRQFCVRMNELEFSKDALKPREQRSGPLITTMGYKYQISMSRQGKSGVVKLLESPTFRTAYMEKVQPPKEFPQPRLPTQQEIKKAGAKRYAPKEKPRWVPKDACTTLLPEYSFQLSEGRYDIYLGFDVLVLNGVWTPLQSDFVTNVVIEKGKVARVEGTVDYSKGVRTVKLQTPPQGTSAGGR